MVSPFSNPRRFVARSRHYGPLLLATLVIGAAAGPAATDEVAAPANPVASKTALGPHPFCSAGKWGYVDNQGNVVVRPQFDAAHDFFEGFAAVSREQDGESGYIRPDGSWAFKMPLRASPAFGRFSEGRARFVENEKSGYLDSEGRVIVKPAFDDAMDFSGGRARVAIGNWIHEFPMPRLDARWGFIDRDGKLSIPVELTSAEDYSDGLALVRRADSWVGYIDSQGRAVVGIDKLLGDSQLLPHVSRHFHDGLAPIEVTDLATNLVNKGAGYIDKSGTLAIPLKFLGVQEFSEGLAAVRTPHGLGFIDRNGQCVIAPQFDDASDFHEGFARVRCGKVWFFVDRRGCRITSRNCDLAGRQIAASPWNAAEDFHGGLARVHVGGEYEVTRDGPAYWHGGIWYYVNAQGIVVSICHRDGEPAGAIGHERL